MAKKKSLYQRWGKRAFDLIVTVPAIIVMSPLMAVISVLVMINLGSPVIFRQKRPGLNGKPFTIYKFRTMNDDRDAEGNLLPDDKRITYLGKLLRKFSLDELPELWNVIKGDMSLVGPRPLLMEYLPYYTKRERIRHSVRPGITGLSQINGRNYLNWDERLEMDVQYVKKISFLLDIKIIFNSIILTIFAKNVAVIPRSIGVPLSVYRRHEKYPYHTKGKSP